MIKPNEDVIRALSNLEGNFNWRVITEWINESLFAQSVKNNHSKGEDTVKMQGRNLELEELLKHIKNSGTYKENLKEKRG